jgi:hypothetical protein
MANRFRKVFIVCKDNQTFSELTKVAMFKYRNDAEFACKKLQELAIEDHKILWNANKPLPKFKVHGFYLVHEDMFRD